MQTGNYKFNKSYLRTCIWECISPIYGKTQLRFVLESYKKRQNKQTNKQHFK